MPEIGYKSITISEKHFDEFTKSYNYLKKTNQLPVYIITFSGFVTYSLEQIHIEKNTLIRIAKKIKSIPLIVKIYTAGKVKI